MRPFSSIRWRLVASYVFLTLLTVLLVGVLALSLVERYVAQQVIEDRTANAEAVARQAASWMWPRKDLQALQELARTSAFLGNVRVRILDDRERVIADSGAPAAVDQFMWLTPPEELDLLGQAWMMVLPADRSAPLQIPEAAVPFFENLPRSTKWTLVQRFDGTWGTRFSFERGRAEDGWPSSPADLGLTPFPDVTAGAAPAVEQASPASGQVVTVPIGERGYVELSGVQGLGTEALATIRRAFLFAAGGTTLFAVALGLLVSQGLTAPLRRLSAVAQRMGEDLSIRAPVRGRDEIGQLAQQLNRMAERLEGSFAALAAERDALRLFIADASHELRTPITALKSFNELLRGPAQKDVAVRQEFLDESAVQLERLEWITHNLLDLSRLDAGLVDLNLTRQAVSDLIETASVAFKVRAEKEDTTFVVQLPPEPLEVVCDRPRIELALSNLLDNAFKFVGTDGRVAIGAQQEAERVQLWVKDNGPGIDPSDEPHIFERFYRGRSSRATGSGLGLALVQSVVRAHDGRVWVETEPGKGSRFIVELPSAGPD